MIKKIQLVSFGKFRDYSISCAPVTVIEGANESGKTTLFDALLEGLCKPKGTTDAGKLLKARYGEARSVILEFEGAPLQLSPVDFLNLFAVRAGDLSVEVAKDSEWLTRVKAQLFSGGIDPHLVADRLTRQCESRAKDTLHGELRELGARVAKLEADIQELQQQRETALREERESAHSEEELERVRSALENLRKEEERLSQSVDQQKLHRIQKELNQLKEALISERALKRELEEMPSYTEDELGTLQLQEQDLKELDAQLQKLRTLEEEARKELQKLQPEIEQAAAQARKIQQIRDLGVSLKTRLQDPSSLIDRRVSYTYRAIYLILAGVVLLLGVGGAWMFPKDLSILPLVVGILGAVLLGFLGIRRQTLEDDTRLRKAVQGICEEWVKEGGDPIPEAAWEGFVTTLVRTEERLKNSRTRLEELHAAEGTLRKRIDALEGELQKCKYDRDEQEKALKTRYHRTKVHDSAQYAAQMERRREKEDRLQKLDRLVREACQRYGTSSPEGLEAFLQAEIERIQHQITEPEQPEIEMIRLQNLLRQHQERKEVLKEEETRLLQVVHRKKGEVSGAYRDLPERILRTEQELARLKVLQQEKELSLKGAERAAAIFRSLALDNNSLLASLSDEIAGAFSRIAPLKGEEGPTDKSRAVRLKTFSLREAEVTDAEGQPRPLGTKERREAKEGSFLSTGTRDAFLLAARLTLARKAFEGGGEAILVMDDPFLTLDTERVERAIHVLQEFQQHTSWQLFLFTKDEELAEKVEARFGQLAHRVRLP